MRMPADDALARRDRPIAAARWLGAGGTLLLAGCQSALLDPRGPVGHAQRLILIDSMAIMLAIVVPTIIATFGFRLVVPRLEQARPLPADWAVLGRHRARGLVDPDAW